MANIMNNSTLLEMPQPVKSLYFNALKLSSRIYFKLKYFFIGASLIALALYLYADRSSLNLAMQYPSTTLALSALFSCIMYGFLGSVTFNIVSRKEISLSSAFLQFCKLQKKWWGGMLLLILPALSALALSQTAGMLIESSPYIAIGLYFIAVILICWSFLYLPMFIIYLASLFFEPTLPFVTSLKYVFRLCCYNWLRIVASTFLYYGVCLVIFDAISAYYLHHLSKGPYFFTNLICVNLIFYLLFPLLTAFNIVLVTDLRIRNLACIQTE